VFVRQIGLQKNRSD